MKRTQFDAAFQQIGHGHVNRLAGGCVKGRGHFHLTVDTLLPQHGHAGPRRPAYGRSDLVLQVKVQARILAVGKGLVLFAGAGRIVAVSLHPIGQLGPRRMEVEQRGVIEEITATANA